MVVVRVDDIRGVFDGDRENTEVGLVDVVTATETNESWGAEDSCPVTLA